MKKDLQYPTTPAQALKMGYRKVPSVTTGGKPYFYFKQDAAGRHWLIWDRVNKSWNYSHED